MFNSPQYGTGNLSMIVVSKDDVTSQDTALTVMWTCTHSIQVVTERCSRISRSYSVHCMKHVYMPVVCTNSFNLLFYPFPKLFGFGIVAAL